MAALSQGNIKSVRFVDIPTLDQVVGLWHLVLQSASDTLTVPGLLTTEAVADLEYDTVAHTILVSAGALTEGQNTVTIAGGGLGVEVLIATRHRTGFLNNLSRDEDPT